MGVIASLRFRRIRLGVLLGCAVLAWQFLAPCPRLRAQTTSATVSGTITDPQGKVVPGVDVQTTNVNTGVVSDTKTNGSGVYVLTGLPPGTYRIVVTKQGFKQVALTDLVLQVQDSISRNFSLSLGATSESVSVTAEGTHMNTTDASVSTVVDRKFLEDIPLNGRSIQTLLMLTPGIQFDENTADAGTFSVNGQRNSANYFTVDGVAANLGATGNGGGLDAAAGGAAPGFNAMGASNSLISVDAIQEFRVQTSTFAPEYGRSPGAQVSMVSRAGTNDWHGTAFDYLRNNIFDANDWFSDSEGLPKAEERQNDFGGVFGGPVRMPHLYNGKDKTFFFFSYEGLRLRQPVNLIGYVPDQTARSQTPAALQPFVNAFPLPNGPEVGGNEAEYFAGVSDPSTMDAYSLRLDQALGSRFRLFGRYDYSPNTTGAFGAPPFTAFVPNQETLRSTTLHTLTFGLDGMITSRISNELRLNYSNSKNAPSFQLVPMGGAVPISDAALSQIVPPGVNPAKAYVSLDIFGPQFTSYQQGTVTPTEQRQLNAVDNLSLVKGPHQMKFGVDYRWLAPLQGSMPYGTAAYYANMSGIASNQPLFSEAFRRYGASLRTKEFSLYAQDTWMATPRLTLTYGLRWDVDPAPTGANLASDPVVVEGLTDPATMRIAPPGTPLYQTAWDNLAPRLGVAYQLRRSPGMETVLRGGMGTFYGTAAGNLGFYTFGFGVFQRASTFPISPPAQLPASRTFPPPPPYPGGTMAVTNLALPRTYEWDLAIEQGLGQNQTLTLTYVGNLGRYLLRDYYFSNNGLNPAFLPDAFFDVTNNSGFSDYQALQAQFQRRAARGLEAIASYTYSHAIDNASDSSNGSTPAVVGNANFDKGNSAYDVRHSFSGALVYAIPAPFRTGLGHALFGGWSVDDLVIARTAFPVDLFSAFYSVGTDQIYSLQARPDVVPGVPLYLYGSQYPGGKRFNPDAFAVPPNNTQGDLGRNVMRGFGAWQDNFAVHRQFNLTEKLNLQFRAEAFNLLNHPNFYDPSGYFTPGDPTFGLSSATLADGLSFGGGLNALYQIGAPRSWQFALRLAF